MTFADLGLGDTLLRAIEELGYKTPTPIQEKSIPYVLMNRDVMGCAQTGTGKTASFTLPMIEILAAGRAKARMPRSVILSPTRELATQIADNFTNYGKYHKLSMALLIGGESFVDQEKKLARGVDVLIATPGRLMDQFERGNILLSDVKILVIDEADRMLDMGFIPDIERIVGLLPRFRQTLFYSATMAKEIRKIAEKFLQNPKEIHVAPPATAAKTITERLIKTTKRNKRSALRDILNKEDVTSALVFCNRKRDIADLLTSLKRHKFEVLALHGDMTQPKRTEALEAFKNKEAKLMICSDVAARGIDISDLSHVFNFDVPINAEDYIHRIGRTGRAGKEGRAFTIATDEEHKQIKAIEKLKGVPFELADETAAPAVEAPVEKKEAAPDATKPVVDDQPRERQPRRRDQRSDKDEVTADFKNCFTTVSLLEDLTEAEVKKAKTAFEDLVPAFMLRPQNSLTAPEAQPDSKAA